MYFDGELGLWFLPHDVALIRWTPEVALDKVKAVLDSPVHWKHIKIMHEEWRLQPVCERYTPDAGKPLEVILDFFAEQGIKPVFYEELLG